MERGEYRYHLNKNGNFSPPLPEYISTFELIHIAGTTPILLTAASIGKRMKIKEEL